MNEMIGVKIDSFLILYRLVIKCCKLNKVENGGDLGMDICCVIVYLLMSL